MDRTDYYKKLEEAKRIINELESYADNESIKFWHMKDEEFTFRTAQQYANLISAKNALHNVGTILAFNTNI